MLSSLDVFINYNLKINSVRLNYIIFPTINIEKKLITSHTASMKIFRLERKYFDIAFLEYNYLNQDEKSWLSDSPNILSNFRAQLLFSLKIIYNIFLRKMFHANCHLTEIWFIVYMQAQYNIVLIKGDPKKYTHIEYWVISNSTM